ncbi:MAG: IS256 family transposase [Planctomycetaceae bacterium]|nr:IS256 family transposase [Planctomycetaceae bacterium]
MNEAYQVVVSDDTNALPESVEIAGVLAKDGQLILPLLDLVEQAQCAIDDLVDVMGRATIEAVLQMSAAQLAGPKQQGRKADQDVVYHGTQKGRVALKERQLGVTKPRLRKRRRDDGESGEVEIPAYEAMQKDARLADRMLQIRMAGISTRRYEDVLPEMAQTVGVSKSQVSREFIESGERLLKELAERDFSEQDILVVYVDGLQFGQYHVICAVGVDASGHKHVLGFREGATENAQVAKALLEDLVERGLSPFRRRLFVIDGSKALRKAIDQVFGRENPVQRCRNHKVRNVLGHLPKDQHDQAKSTMKAAFKLKAEDGIAKLKQYASWLQQDWPSASASLHEGLDELFTINRLGLPSKLRRCLGTTNLIDNSHSAVRQRSARVKHWRDGLMALRWTAASFAASEKHFRRIMGHQDLWMLEADLNEPQQDHQLAEHMKAS